MKKSVLTCMVFVLIAALGSAAPALAGKKDVLVIGMATSDIISLDPAKAFEFSGVGIEVQIYDRLLDFPAGKFDTPEMSLAEIADACGFCDQSYFTRVFNETKGQTPGQFRQHQRTNGAEVAS